MSFFFPVPLLISALVFFLGSGFFAVHADNTSVQALTLAQAQKLAVAHSHQLSAQDWAIAASQQMAVAARQLPDPVLKLGVDNLPASGSDRFSLGRDFMTMRRIGVMQEITRGDKRQLRADRYQREAEKLSAEKTLTLAGIERDSAIAWLDRYYAQAMLTLIAQQAAQAQLEIEAAEGAYRAGRGSWPDVLMAHSALAVFQDRRSEAQRRLSSAKIGLARWTGIDGEILLAGLPSMQVIALNKETLDNTFAHHPQIAVLNKQAAIMEGEVKLAHANQTPDWSVEATFQQRGPAYSNMVSLGVTIPLQWDRKNRQNRELSAKMALLEQAKAEREEILRAHVAETRSMINEWENGRERGVRYTRELIPLASARTNAVMAAYRGGKANLAELLASRRNEIDVRLQGLQLEMETARLWAKLNFLSSSTIENSAPNLTYDIGKKKDSP